MNKTQLIQLLKETDTPSYVFSVDEFEQRAKLVKKYYWLAPANVWTGLIPKDYDYTYINWGWSEGWDRAYFVSTMKKDFSYKIPLTIQEIKMAELIAAVRLGRAIKKGLAETSMRREIFETWRTMYF